jgi:hypothetical protein
VSGIEGYKGAMEARLRLPQDNLTRGNQQLIRISWCQESQPLDRVGRSSCFEAHPEIFAVMTVRLGVTALGQIGKHVNNDQGRRTRLVVTECASYLHQ